MATKKTATRVSKVTKAELKQYDDEKRIVLFFNEKPADADPEKEYPIMRGNITIDGKKYWISLWNQTSQDGELFLQGKAQPAQTSAEEAKNDIKAKLMAKL